MFHDDESNRAAVLISFLVGGIVGAGMALLFAPQSGKRTRGKIADLAEDARDYASDYANKLKKKIS
jgi:gas vesicle protein